MVLPPLTRNRKRGFTLIELLVVIGLIVLLAGVLSFSLRDPGGTVGVSSGVRISASMVTSARQQAILKSKPARIIIATESQNSEKRLRYMGVIYQNPDDPTGTTTWIAANDGTYLPNGVYFDETHSKQFETMNIVFPRATPQSEGGGDEYEWFYYEFKSSGLLNDLFLGARFVVNAGRVIDADGKIALSGTTEYAGDSDSQNPNIGGFVIHKMGTISVAQSSQDLLQ